MINQNEIDHKAEELDVHVANVQRDYVFGWLLKELFADAYIATALVLKGGNCFRKAYFPDARYSDDLDFSINTELDKQKFMAALAESCKRIEHATGVKFDPDRSSMKEEGGIDFGTSTRLRTYRAKIYFDSFYGEVDSISIAVRMDIAEFDKIYLPIQTRPLIHSYSDFQLCAGDIKCLTLEEMVANKMKCLIQRRHSHDLFDVVYSNLVKNVDSLDRTAIISTFLRKTIFQSSPHSAKQLLLKLPMDYFKGAWERYIVAPITSRYEFDAAKDRYIAMVTELFSDYREAPGAAAAFFPAELRNPIMDAARENKMLKINYGGHTRLVEPYALSFKRRADGVVQEYFYCWDTTGGSSAPGVKTMLNTKISHIEVVDQTFEPRFEVELTKAGEIPKQSYFGANGRLAGIRRVTTRSAYSATQRTYTIQCPYCQKRFKRTKPSTKLNPHKSPDGFACNSRNGYMV